MSTYETEYPKITNLNDDTQRFTNSILEIANLTIGQTKFLGKKPQVPWWNSQCNDSIKLKKAAFNTF